jgi:F-box-like
MSISSICQLNVLGEDVLQIIFQELDAEDLLKCEAVCRQWRDILMAGRPWRVLYHRNIACLPQWWQAQKELEFDQKTLRTDQYRGICKDILRRLQLQLQLNWRRGHFTKSTYPMHPDSVTYISLSDDYVVWDLHRFCNGKCHIGFAFLNKESMEIKKIPSSGWLEKLNEMLVYWRDRGSGYVEIVNPKNHWVVNVWDGLDDEGKKYFDFKFGSKLLVTYDGRKDADKERIRIWKMRNQPVLLHDRIYKFRNLQLEKVDERFIVLHNVKTLYFISSETFEEFRTLSLRYHQWHYDRGLLFQSYDDEPYNIIRTFDVASGTFFNDIRKRLCSPRFRLLNRWASSNSRFMVIGWRDSFISHFSFYDLEAMKNPRTDGRCYLLYTLQFQFELRTFVMDEKRIAFNGIDRNHWNVTVLNFADNSEGKHETKREIIFPPKDKKKFERWCETSESCHT